MGQSTKKGIDDVIEDKQSVEFVGGNSEVEPTARNLENYVPPRGGEILKKKFFSGVEKTIIFVPEVHKSSTGVGKKNDPLEGLVNSIHAQKFDVVVDLVQKFGKTPIVLEAWDKEDTGADILDHPNFKTALFEQLRSGGTLKSRLVRGRRLVAETGVPAYIVLLAVLGKDLLPVGVGSVQELDKTDKAVEFARDYYNLVQSKKPVCKTGEGEFVSFDGMLNEIGRGNSESVMHCFCAVENLKDKMEDVIDEREDAVAINEVEAALERLDDLVIVSSGELHNKSATAYLDEKKAANYMVISPVTMRKYLEMTKLTEREGSPDNGFGPECKMLEDSNPGVIQRTVREMLKLSN